MNDYEIIDFLEKKIEETRGDKQEEWVRKYDTFTNRNLFKEHNSLDKLTEVEKVRMEVLKYE